MSEYFPSLDGRVVDGANMLRDDVKTDLIEILKSEEEKSSNQIVIATIKSLHGYEVEDFSLQLARHWALGQKGKNNGVLLLIAKNEKKIRIEVGYGLEEKLTDKIAHEIITYTITPAFKKGNFNEGILQGSKEIIEAVNEKYQEKKKVAKKKSDLTYIFYLTGVPASYILALIFIAIGSFFKKNFMKRLGYSVFVFGIAFVVINEIVDFSFLVNIILSMIGAILYFIYVENVDDDSINYYSGGNSGFSGGFSGGGGSFGGGGASGGW